MSLREFFEKILTNCHQLSTEKPFKACEIVECHDPKAAKIHQTTQYCAWTLSLEKKKNHKRFMKINIFIQSAFRIETHNTKLLLALRVRYTDFI